MSGFYWFSRTLMPMSSVSISPMPVSRFPIENPKLIMLEVLLNNVSDPQQLHFPNS